MNPHPPLRLLEHTEGQVHVPAAVCQALGFERIWARPSLDPSAAVVLAELGAESCGHSWRGALHGVSPDQPEALVASVIKQVEATRPTTLYTYWGQSAQGESPIAVAALSSHVAHDFHCAGFPVVARCVIRRCYRGHGLYPHLLRHRLDLCRALWGSELRAIHIGAADPAVLATLSRQLTDAYSFSCVGVERLEVAGERFWVPDFLAATPKFRADLARELQDSDPRIARLAIQVQAFLTQGASAVSYLTLKEAVRTAKQGHGAGWWASCPNLKALLGLCDAIGVQAR
jgi:hypothetical protein